MRSLSRGEVAGNTKLNGKRSVLLGCRCCVVENLKPAYIEGIEKKEIESFKKGEGRETETETIGTA